MHQIYNMKREFSPLLTCTARAELLDISPHSLPLARLPPTTNGVNI